MTVTPVIFIRDLRSLPDPPSESPGATLRAVDSDVCAVDPARSLREQEHDHVGDLARRTETLPREVTRLVGSEVVRMLLPEPFPVAPVIEDRTGTHHVDAN